MPQPRNSIHPLACRGGSGIALPRLPLPPQMKQLTYISALGSVNGKNDGRKLVFTLEPNSAFMAWSSVPFRSPKVMFVSTAKPFDLMKHRRVAGIGRIVAMNFSRNHDPQRRLQLLHGANLHRRCVRAQQQRSRCGFDCLIGENSVSCVSRAGWFGGKFSASKL